ncbi:MAG: organic solvent ABC transporter ATP-binding protein [Betaproteobacteria bacterium]|nr:organic solvent ABC transporter ATP-binding protein [Betaproteobacteria bacterium]
MSTKDRPSAGRNVSDAVLDFRQVTVEGGHPYDTAIWQISFRLGRSELMLLRLEAGHLCLPLADVAQGMVEPIEGSVSFLGERWSALSDEARLAARARIGRVFDEPGWISDLDMDENITLSQRHHTRRTEAAIRDEASELARRFSLPGLPQGKPSDMRAPDLRRAACVRAFLGQPELLILERPTAGVYPEIMPALMASVRAARSRGAAVLWTTDDWEVWNDAGIKPTSRCAMTGSQMSILPGD